MEVDDIRVGIELQTLFDDAKLFRMARERSMHHSAQGIHTGSKLLLPLLVVAF